jgi:hypothetical protein
MLAEMRRHACETPPNAPWFAHQTHPVEVVGSSLLLRPPHSIHTLHHLPLLILPPLRCLLLPQRWPSCIQLPLPFTLQLQTRTYRHVPSEAFAHVDHSALTLPVALLELLALGREGFEEWGPEAFERGMSLNEYAVGGGKARGECGA